jgi:2,3,4,5-tetrahydropyridine-2-carboxylate N-succinyltransferase
MEQSLIPSFIIWVLKLSRGSIKPDLSRFEGADNLRKIKKVAVAIEIDIANAPKDVSDAYLRLHLLSHRIIKPHGLSLDGIFGILNNVVWTSHGPCAVAHFNEVREALREKYGYVTVFNYVDKFPRMVDYVIPEGVRIADADRVRLGAPRIRNNCHA